MSDTLRFRSTSESSLKITEQAASWYLDQREGLSDAEQRQFLAWLRRSPVHLHEYLAIAQLHGDMQAATALEKLDAHALVELAAAESAVVSLRHGPLPSSAAHVARRKRQRVMPWLAAVAGLVLAMTVAWIALAPTGGPIQIYAADAGSVRSLSLTDGTLVQLDKGSAIAVRFDEHVRHIEVQRGSAVFDIGKDPARPLSVTVGDHLLRDIGTVFAVHSDGAQADVMVLSGRIQVLERGSRWNPWTASSSRLLADLHGGERWHVDAFGQTSHDDRADPAAVTAWLPADIRFQRDTVANVARRFNAYTTRPLDIEDEDIARTRLSGTFHARDVDAFLAYLKTFPRVRIVREPDRIRVVTAVRSHAATQL
ncbi:FecR family protein [Dyella sp.]|uniref:FecR family protein n=1 Tax=Dyella sp. TaxID=1869338 RepID=UPI002ED33143